ncbi:gliding motility protein GldC [Tellurirhabdus bombi]|uniref:gliding motility protein GldC n=1 Tax=Tellurirhabdus bombi TaxID=2907205 RepID=UPI001F17F8D0|nr:gliding motility protein GldC [Tellurirhabdus bombi]
MKKSDIHFTVELDNQNIPEKIYWNATDNPNEGLSDTKAIAVAIWDHYHRNTLRLNLWTKDMEVTDMKRFCIEVIGSLADMMTTATGDEQMANEIDNICRIMSKRVEEEYKSQQQQPNGH